MLERGAFTGAFRVGNVTTRNSLNLETIVSDRARSALVDSLDLVSFFGLAEMARERPEEAHQRAMRELVESTHFELSMQLQVLIIHVTTRDPVMSARIANAFLDVLQAINLDRFHRFAQDKVRFLDARLGEVRESLLTAEARLAAVHREQGVVDLEKDRESAYSLLKGLREQLLDRRLRYETIMADAGASAPEAIALEAEITVYERMIAALANEMAGAARDAASAVPLTVGPVTEMALRRMERELQTLESLEGFLVQDREAARLQAVLDMETLTILDRAVPPAEPIWPRRHLMIALVATCALLTASLGAIGLESLRSLGNGSAGAGLRTLLGDS
jgi:uncharacterized protein involved in exopolysaccharide biosynthesis